MGVQNACVLEIDLRQWVQAVWWRRVRVDWAVAGVFIYYHKRCARYSCAYGCTLVCITCIGFFGEIECEMDKMQSWSQLIHCVFAPVRSCYLFVTEQIRLGGIPGPMRLICYYSAVLFCASPQIFHDVITGLTSPPLGLVLVSCLIELLVRSP